MVSSCTSCIKCVGETVEIIRYGKTGYGKQRYQCKKCKKTFIKDYSYQAYKADINSRITTYVKEGLGIRSISRVIGVSTNTVMSRIKIIAANIESPLIGFGEEYEVDELCSFIGSKTRRIWIVIALRKDTRKVLVFKVGNRTKVTIKNVIDTLLLAKSKKIHTDRLRLYNSTVPNTIHSVCQYGTNHVERLNLSLRTHLKRLNRRTICFSRSKIMLTASLKIYFWG